MSGVKIWLLIVVMMSMTLVNAQDSTKSGLLTVVFTGLEEEGGHILVALANSEENYEDDDNPYRATEVEVLGDSLTCQFNDLPFGEYAIKSFHDKNEDDELDTNFFGIPTEIYGFSNNARGSFGPPSFGEAKFKFESDSLDIKIKLY